MSAEQRQLLVFQYNSAYRHTVCSWSGDVDGDCLVPAQGNVSVAIYTIRCYYFCLLYFQHQKFLNDSLHGSNGSKAYLSTPEIKLLVVFFFYVVFAVSVLMYNMVVTDVYGSQLLSDIEKFFTCELIGNGSDHCLNPNGSQDIEYFSFPYLLAILLALLGVVPLVNLVFAVNWNHLKDKLKLCRENVKNQRYGTFRYSLPQKAVNYSAVSKT